MQELRKDAHVIDFDSRDVTKDNIISRHFSQLRSQWPSASLPFLDSSLFGHVVPSPSSVALSTPRGVQLLNQVPLTSALHPAEDSILIPSTGPCLSANIGAPSWCVG